MTPNIYLLPGRGGRLNQGLGAELLGRGYHLVGRELQGEFHRFAFASQVESVTNDLQNHFWDEESRVIANSFGAYLFLHAQASLAPFPGRVLLLSPVVGEAAFEEKMMFFVPPRAGLLKELVLKGRYPTPLNWEVHVGADDWQSNPPFLKEMGEAHNFYVNVVPGAGHRLPPDYVGKILDRWLCES